MLGTQMLFNMEWQAEEFRPFAKLARHQGINNNSEIILANLIKGRNVERFYSRL